jgi:Ca-activated chloride channel family protein
MDLTSRLRPQRSHPAPAAWVVTAALATCLSVAGALTTDDAPGSLRITSPDVAARTCPLRHTDVDANIAGFVSRVTVRQQFENPLPQKIDAVYVFPLPQHAAVDQMVMTVGDRRIVGEVRPRDEARRIYDEARARGNVATLLDQERPNIFTQSVANIEPGARVVVEISYVETLRYEDGFFEFVFPMVVGPRYIPGTPTGHSGTGWAPDTTAVLDASRISPPVPPKGTRAGHDIGLTVTINAGTEIREFDSVLHDVDTERPDPTSLVVRLRPHDQIPNRDFILRYRTASKAIGDAVLVHEDQDQRFLTLVLQPPRRVTPADAVPKELIFVIDRSGSMSGFPIEKAKEAMRLAIENLNPKDTFNLMSFAGGTGRCFDAPVPNTPENRALALRYLADLHGQGGTEMMPAIHAALDGAAPAGRVRIVAFMTDGYIGNDFEIIDAVRQRAGTARVFAFGIGNSVNRFLLDGMAHAGRGAVEYVTLQSDAEAAVSRFRDRIQAPVLTDIAIDWGHLPVSDVYPRQLPDLFSETPLLIHARLTGPARDTLVLRGRTAQGPFERRIPVAPTAAAPHDALPSMWARAAVEDLMQRERGAVQRGEVPAAIREEITALGVTYHLITQFTSFVAVEEMHTTLGGEATTVAVPVEMPAGVSYEGVFGEAGAMGGVRTLALAPRGYRGIMALHAPASTRQADGRFAKEATSASPADKIDVALRGLAAKVARDGRNGTLTVGDVRIVNHRVGVTLVLRDRSRATLAALKHLGFDLAASSAAAPVVVGTIDVRKLDALAALDAVVEVRRVRARA